MQVYDRVLPSKNLTTLVALTTIIAFVYVTYSLLETLRSRILIRAGVLFDRAVNPHVFELSHRLNLSAPSPGNVQILRDIDVVREFFTGQGLLSLCDIPWVPIYVAAAFALHPYYGYLAIGSTLISVALALLNEFQTRQPLGRATHYSATAQNYAVSTLRNGEVLQAMGMVEVMRNRWSNHHEDALGWQAQASNIAAPLLAATKFHRTLVQSLILALGAWLVIEGQVTAGSMIAGSIIIRGALGPAEMAIGHWKSFIAMRHSFWRLMRASKASPVEPQKMKLPKPNGAITFENVSAVAPGTSIPVLSQISIHINAGTILGVVGPSAAGKSSFARVLVGVWPTVRGRVRIDGSDINHWNTHELGRYFGYLPQGIELFPGTVAENISRFDPHAEESKIIEAAMLAGIHEMIQKLPKGYNTELIDNGASLSGGQRQRIGLARAVYGVPPMIVLDEPNSNLDVIGEAALINTINELKDRGVTVILVTHKSNILAMTDEILVISAGQIQAHGGREEIMTVMSPHAVVPGANPTQKQITS